MDAPLALAGRFALPGVPCDVQPYGNGHINDTYRFYCEGRPYILQRLNGYVFPDPEGVNGNIRKVTEFLRERIREESGDPDRETLRLIPTREGSDSLRDADGGSWRVFPFVEGTINRDLPENEALFEETGRGFGRFLRRLDGFPADTLCEVIPGFHDTPSRYAQLMEAAERDSAGRLSGVTEEMAFCRARKADCGRLLAENLPVRVTHNDTKINNLLLDAKTGKALCVIDLDTVMPGLCAYDFGDAIRTGASTAAEDERDLTRVSLSLPMFSAFARGYLSEASCVLTRDEIRSLPLGARLMTLENGLRFLADYLNGDLYFHVSRQDQNLDRARAQFALVKDMEEKEEAMLASVLACASGR